MADISNIQTEVERIDVGDVKLYTKRFLSSGTPRASILFLHGFIEHIGRYETKFPPFAAKGIEVTAFDQRGFGQTSLEAKNPKAAYSDTTWDKQFADNEVMVLAERKRLDEKYGAGKVPLFLFGHSMGGGLAIGFFTRSPSSNKPSAEAKKAISGVILSSPWLKLSKPPPGFLVGVMSRLVKTFPNIKWTAGLAASDLTRNVVVQKAVNTDPLCNNIVYMRAIYGPLTGGPEIVSTNYKFYPSDLPILALHGDKDAITDHKATAELLNKLEASDKTNKKFEGCYHEILNEPDGSDVTFTNTVIDWILERSSKANGADDSSPAATSASAQLPATAADDPNANPAAAATLGVSADAPTTAAV